MEQDTGGLSPEQLQWRRQDNALSKYRSSQRSNAEAWRTRQGRVPRPLYHYTTLPGLRGIVESHSLWASDVRYLNDSSELTYAAELIDGVVAEVMAEAEYESLRAHLPERPDFANQYKYGLRPFVACFCEEQDLLSQWRGYSAGQAAFSLGLDLSSMGAMGHLPPRTRLRKVVYDEAEQRRRVREAVEAWLRTSMELLGREGVKPEDVFPELAIWGLQEALDECYLTFKHPTFKEEREWRLIKLVDLPEELQAVQDRLLDERMEETFRRWRELGVEPPRPPSMASTRGSRAEGIQVQFRPSNLGLVPFVDLPLRERAGVFTDRLPLTHVRQGPTSNPELALESLRMFLASKGFSFYTEVSRSTIPLRPHQ